MGLRDILLGKETATREASNHAIDQFARGEISKAQAMRVSARDDEARRATMAYDADHPRNETDRTPAADTRMLATVNGVVVDLASTEYAEWYRQVYG
jgi:hypothetical protein